MKITRTRCQPMDGRNGARAALLLLLLFLIAPAPGLAAQQIQWSDFEERLGTFIVEHPDASFSDVARTANGLIGEVGYNFSFDYCTEEQDVTVMLHGEERDFSIETSSESTPCGQHFLSIPISGLSSGRLRLIQDGRSWELRRPEELFGSEIKILSPDLTRVLAVVEAPFESIPYRVMPDGRGVVVYDGLPEEARAWWLKQIQIHPELPANYMFLPLILDADGFRYAEDPAFLADQRSRFMSELPWDGLAHDEYFDPHVVLQYPGPCT
jgi:hypothetical protein